MTVINTIALILSFIFMISTVIALINPRLLKMKRRLPTFGLHLLLLLIALMIVGFTAEVSPENESSSVALEQQEHERDVEDAENNATIEDNNATIEDNNAEIENKNEFLEFNQTYYDIIGQGTLFDYSKIYPYIDSENLGLELFTANGIDGYLCYRGEVNNDGEPDGNGILFTVADEYVERETGIIAYGEFKNGKFKGGNVRESYVSKANFKQKNLDETFYLPGDTYFLTSDKIVNGIPVRANGLSGIKVTINENDYIYVGDTVDNLAHGNGKLFVKRYPGIWVALAEGNFVEGDFIEGILYDRNGVPVYMGEYSESQDSKGVMFQYSLGYYVPYLEGEFETKYFGDPLIQWLEYTKLIEGFIYNELGLFSGYGTAGFLNNNNVENHNYIDTGYRVDWTYNDTLSITYSGEVKEGYKSGYGTSYYSYPLGGTPIIEYEGYWNENVYHGQGILYKEDGSVKYEGQFINGDI